MCAECNFKSCSSCRLGSRQASRQAPGRQAAGRAACLVEKLGKADSIKIFLFARPFLLLHVLKQPWVGTHVNLCRTELAMMLFCSKAR